MSDDDFDDLDDTGRGRGRKKDKEDDDHQLPPKRFIRIKDTDYTLSLLCSIQKKELYNYERHDLDYCLIINQDPSEKMLYANTFIRYNRKDDRDREWDKLVLLLEELKIIQVLKM